MSSICFSRPLLPLGLCIFLVLFHGCLAQLTTPWMQTQQSSRLSGRSECQIDRIIAREPNRRVESEAGISEFWDSFENDELECAGVEAVRHTINPRGLLLPYYPSAPELVYVVRGTYLFLLEHRPFSVYIFIQIISYFYVFSLHMFLKKRVYYSRSTSFKFENGKWKMKREY